uniref:Uncharacterized protein n=1 Tax=Anguilla anguilla TaxID=7936 RepID=A0A0E9VAT4_ANGAN
MACQSQCWCYCLFSTLGWKGSLGRLPL